MLNGFILNNLHIILESIELIEKRFSDMSSLNDLINVNYAKKDTSTYKRS
ncbi:hypothetical protein MTBBW1_900008 [Desulfamplus magnetovallimortis]|uniref:Uncharacterized protein n=1 Tax=Desulfamplus magnetovallimortis TaxID=1246637 RepID=A0A1W1HKX3_9BACT|nr:hypothetical protein MTBBW1_900008 [Desulfamplus magnetovallimortis]